MILECIYIPKKVRLFRRDYILIRDTHLLTLTASVAAAPKWVRKRPRLFALHTFIILPVWR